MADSIKTFPTTDQEASALVYVQAQDLSNKTPEDVADIYSDAFRRITDRLRVLNGELPYFSKSDS